MMLNDSYMSALNPTSKGFQVTVYSRTDHYVLSKGKSFHHEFSDNNTKLNSDNSYEAY